MGKKNEIAKRGISEAMTMDEQQLYEEMCIRDRVRSTNFTMMDTMQKVSVNAFRAIWKKSSGSIS